MSPHKIVIFSALLFFSFNLVGFAPAEADFFDNFKSPKTIKINQYKLTVHADTSVHISITNENDKHNNAGNKVTFINTLPKKSSSNFTMELLTINYDEKFRFDKVYKFLSFLETKNAYNCTWAWVGDHGGDEGKENHSRIITIAESNLVAAKKLNQLLMDYIKEVGKYQLTDKRSLSVVDKMKKDKFLEQLILIVINYTPGMFRHLVPPNDD